MPPKEEGGGGQQRDESAAGNMPPRRQAGPKGPVLPGIPKELEGVLPTDPEALKRIAGNLKDVIGDAPFKFRDQVMKDLQHVPNDVATMLSAINELISNIADNPKAEKFVMNAIQTAVKNDGILGSVGKMLKMTSSLGPMGKRGGGGRSASRSGRTGGTSEFDDGLPLPVQDGGATPIRRKKVKIQTDTDKGSLDEPGESLAKGVSGDADAKMSSGDGDAAQHKKKINIVTDSRASTPDDAADVSINAGGARAPVVEQQLMDALRTSSDDGGIERDISGAGENDAVIRKKISIQNEEDEGRRPVDKNDPKVYRTMESEATSEDFASDMQNRQKKNTESSKSRGSLNHKTNNQG